MRPSPRAGRTRAPPTTNSPASARAVWRSSSCSPSAASCAATRAGSSAAEGDVMASNSTRSINLVFTGDHVAAPVIAAAANAASPAAINAPITLASGANTITVPTGGTTPTAVTIVKPAGNTVLITLKGVTGDTGVPL